mmetsp:Transcript_17146/g.30805  ORF Transcript_17146/g.30805 Transcript_17146/m.30805 type:complete len:342 (+) Transcript_17146:219-1244(+)
MMLFARRPTNSTFMLSALIFAAPSSDARPSILEEQHLGYYRSFVEGSYVGLQSLLALTGFYEEDNVKRNLHSESFNVNANEKDSQTEIKVAGLGLGRTGSTSLVMALEILGYVVMHDDEQTEETDLYAAYEDDMFDDDRLHEILGLRGYNATFKTADYEWVAEHAEVKGILTVRDDPDTYVDSWLVAAPFIDIVQRAPFKWMPTVRELMPELRAEYIDETTGGDVEKYLDRDVLREYYTKYTKEVQDSIPPERLLTFNVKQGWGPLCEYLGHPVPEGIPFPHVHTRAKLEGEMFFLQMITWVWKLFEVISFASILAVTVKAKVLITKTKRASSQNHPKKLE